MLSGGAPMYAEKAPWLAIFPGVAISLAVFGFNLSGIPCAMPSIRSCAIGVDGRHMVARGIVG